MNQYIKTLLIISVIGGIVTSLLSNDGGIKKHINYIIGLICAFCLISPLVSFASNMNKAMESIEAFTEKISTQNTIDKTNKIIIDTGVEKVCEGIKSTLINKYDLDESEVEVTAIANTDNIQAVTINEIKVTLKGKSSWQDEGKIKDFLENIVGCKISIIKK